jgi:hypothetical protein
VLVRSFSTTSRPATDVRIQRILRPSCRTKWRWADSTGIVAASDLMATVVHSIRLCGAVVFVSDLAQSLGFYQPLLRYPITVGDADAALLTGPNGSQFYLRQAGEGPDAP